jgi:hypothetical protein
MPDQTLIAFSASGKDYIVVEGTPTEVDQKLSIGNRSGSGLVQLTQLPDQGQTFGPAPVFVNPERVAYLRPPANRGSTKTGDF